MHQLTRSPTPDLPPALPAPLFVPFLLLPQEIEALLDAHAATFANPSGEQVLRHTILSGDERVAFFEVLPKAAAAAAAAQSSFWDFLGQI